MQRTSIIAGIFGYAVCLLAVVIFFASAAGVVNNAFRVAHPTAAHHMIAGRHMQGRFGMHRPMLSESAAATQTPSSNRVLARARFVADARFDAVRRLVVALVMLLLSIAVFRRTFGWLNPAQAVTT